MPLAPLVASCNLRNANTACIIPLVPAPFIFESCATICCIFCEACVILPLILPALAPMMLRPLLALVAEVFIVLSFAITLSNASRNGCVPTAMSLKDFVTPTAVFFAVFCISFSFWSASFMASRALFGIDSAAPKAELPIINL